MPASRAAVITIGSNKISEITAISIVIVATHGRQKVNDVFTFTLPCIATMSIGIAVISDFLLLPVVITAALLAGTLSLLVSWTSEQKKHQIKENKNALNYIVFIIMRNSSMSLEAM